MKNFGLDSSMSATFSSLAVPRVADVFLTGMDSVSSFEVRIIRL